MKIIYCHSCDEVLAETEMTIPGHCPICGCEAHDMMETVNSKRALEFGNYLIENLWMYFGECAYDGETETILEDFIDFPAGTWREDVWHWFDKAYSKGVHELMYM